jgi:hypothetical protein
MGDADPPDLLVGRDANDEVVLYDTTRAAWVPVATTRATDPVEPLNIQKFPAQKANGDPLDFLGLNEDNKPVFYDGEQWKEMGTGGGGSGGGDYFFRAITNANTYNTDENTQIIQNWTADVEFSSFNYTRDFDAATATWTCPASGVYQVMLNATVKNAKHARLYLYRNAGGDFTGEAVAISGMIIDDAGSDSVVVEYQQPQVDRILHLTEGDTLTATSLLKPAPDGPTSEGSKTSFSIVRLGTDSPGLVQTGTSGYYLRMYLQSVQTVDQATELLTDWACDYGASHFSHDVASGVWTCPTDGFYQMHLMARCHPLPSGSTEDTAIILAVKRTTDTGWHELGNDYWSSVIANRVDPQFTSAPSLLHVLQFHAGDQVRFMVNARDNYAQVSGGAGLRSYTSWTITRTGTEEPVVMSNFDSDVTIQAPGALKCMGNGNNMGFDNMTDTNWTLRLNTGPVGSLHCGGDVSISPPEDPAGGSDFKGGVILQAPERSSHMGFKIVSAAGDGIVQLIESYGSANLQMSGESGHQLHLDGNAGNITITGAYTPSCDDRIKSYEFDLSNATATLLQLHPKRYEKHPGLRLDEDDEAPDLTDVSHFTEVGFIAQDVEQVSELQFMVSTMEGSDTKTIAPMNLIGYLVKGFQEMNARLIAAEAKLADL